MIKFGTKQFSNAMETIRQYSKYDIDNRKEGENFKYVVDYEQDGENHTKVFYGKTRDEAGDKFLKWEKENSKAKPGSRQFYKLTSFGNWVEC